MTQEVVGSGRNLGDLENDLANGTVVGERGVSVFREERSADDTVGILRTLAGRNPHDKALHDLVGELSTRSEDFQSRWARHNVHEHLGGSKNINHPVVGRLELMYDTTPIAQAPGLTMIVYTAAPGTPTADAVQLLASWAATQEQTHDESGQPSQQNSS